MRDSRFLDECGSENFRTKVIGLDGFRRGEGDARFV